MAYERVSTAQQGARGLGLEAQRRVIEDFAASRGAEILERFTEVESGRQADWPELVKALHLAKVTGATLVIAKLDQLSSSAVFLLALHDSGVRFAAESLRRAGKGGATLRAAVSANAAAFVTDLAPVLADIEAAGHTSLQAIAAELTVRGIGTRRGGKWRVGSIRRLFER